MTIKNQTLEAIELTPEELAELEEGTRCSSGLMCRALRIRNYPAPLGHYLSTDSEGRDHPREEAAWRFGNDPLDGRYCEECTIEIEREEAER